MQIDSHAGLARASTPAGRVEVDCALGNLRGLSFAAQGGAIAPLHSAPWSADEEVSADESLLPIERRLAGDFFCAPFGANDVEAAPAHGWPANSAWDIAEQGGAAVVMRLRKLVLGASIMKELRLSADAPLIYQTHVIQGGRGALTVAHHPMVRLTGRGRFSCSAKRAVLTPDAALEPGRNLLALSQRCTTLEAVRSADGVPVDLTDLPIADAHEDFVTLVEKEGNTLGWSAVLREVEDDIVFVLKDPRVLPITMLWHSNGGRDHPPWNGRHRGVLGIEDGCAAGASGHAAALAPNPVAGEGVRTALPLTERGRHRIAHVIGAIRRPAGWRRVTDIAPGQDSLILTGDTGTSVSLAFDTDFFREIA